MLKKCWKKKKQDLEEILLLQIIKNAFLKLNAK